MQFLAKRNVLLKKLILCCSDFDALALSSSQGVILTIIEDIKIMQAFIVTVLKNKTHPILY